MTLRIFLATLALASLSHAIVINNLIDSVLDSARVELRQQGKTTLTIPDMAKHFEVKIFRGFTVGGDFSATGGTFKDVSSFKRTGDVTMTTSGDTVTLGFSMGMDTLQVNFSNYWFKFLTVTSTGSFYASCSQNALSGVISLQRQGDKCNVDVKKASIDSLGGFDVQMTGPGDFNKIGNLLLPWVLNEFNDKIRSALNERLEDALTSALKNVDLCSQF